MGEKKKQIRGYLAPTNLEGISILEILRNHGCSKVVLYEECFATSINQSGPEPMSSSDGRRWLPNLSRSTAALSPLRSASGVFQDPSGNIRMCLKQALGTLSAKHLKYVPRNAWEFVK